MNRSADRERKLSDALSFIREKGKVTRSELGLRFSLDKKTVAALVHDMLQDGLIAPAGFHDSLAGRRQEYFAINGDYGNFIGIDLGGTHMIGVLTDFRGRVHDRVFFEIRPGLPVDIIIEQMNAIGRKLLGSDKSSAAVRAIGICAPGFIDPTTGTSLIAENITGWRDIKLKEIFEKELARPVFIDDTSRAFAMAESLIGDGVGRRDFLLADLGYGIGMAVVAGGALYRGNGNKSGELGHLIVQPGGAECACGNRGCLETVASGRAIAQEASRGMQAGKSELLLGLTHGKAETVTAQDVCIAASMGDSFSASLIREAGRFIGLALGSAVNLLNPSRVILGGGLILSNTILAESITAALGEYCMKEIRRDLDVTVSRLGIDGSAIGSAFIAMSDAAASLRPSPGEASRP